MSIILNWKQQPGQTLDSIEIYRYDGPRQSVNPVSPGEPIATLPGNTTTYEDKSTEAYKTYQYRIVAVKGKEKVMGLPIVQGDFPMTGPGPQELIRGDWWRGYFGTLTNEEFIFSYVEMNGLIGFYAWNNSPKLFHKFVYKGRILFIPDTYTRSGTSWNEQYRQGLAWGTDDFGSAPAGVTNTNQRKTFNKDGYEYVLRLPRLADYNYVHSSYFIGSSYLLEGEWHNTFASLFRYSGVVRRLGDLPTRTGTAQADVTSTLFANGYSNNSPWYYRAGAPDSPSWTSQSNGATVFHVIELVLS
ncbi:hypothetical protein WI971_23760 [Salmonella enterica subsp. enterica serovar Corvallis]